MKKRRLSDLIYELASLSGIPRSGMPQFWFEDFESISEHHHKVTFCAYFLAKILKADINKVLLMALFHDCAETRTGDSNWVQKHYVKQDENKAITDQWSDLPDNLGKEIIELLKEYDKRESIESKIVKDADNIAFYITMKQLAFKGNKEAEYRLKNEATGPTAMNTELGENILKDIVNSEPNDWIRTHISETFQKYKKSAGNN